MRKVWKRNGIAKYTSLIFILVVLSLNLLTVILNSNLDQKIIPNNLKQESIHTSSTEYHTKQWLENSNFSSQESWFSLKENDISDVDANISGGQANFRVLGEDRVFLDISGKPLQTEWTKVINPEFSTYPDTAIINSDGCFVSHTWMDNAADQFPSVHWDRNITMPVDMSDYIITSASVVAVVNGTATTSPGGWGDGGIECPGDTFDNASTYDYVRFYVLLSDLEKNKVYEVAYFQTVNLGQDSPAISTMTDTNMTMVPEDDLIFFLTSVLLSDNRNFTISLGIRIMCEDNIWSDEDRWNSLIINSCDLTFTYQKKINRFTSVSWNQVGDTISRANTQIKNSTLNFKYKINETWPELLSPNSEIRILINNNSYTETIKLSTLTMSFQEAKVGGIDVTFLIQKGVNISLSIQVFLADTFNLDHDITISIDDVYLKITYIVVTLEFYQEPWFFTLLLIIASIIGACIGGYLIAYYKVLRYPRPVRKVRKYRKTLRKTNAPSTPIVDRERAFKGAYKREIAAVATIAKVSPAVQKTIPDKLKTTAPKQTPPAEVKTKTLEEKIEHDKLIEKSLEKKEELDKLVEKAKDK